MVCVYRSESDAFVLIHEATQTVVLGETLDEAYQRLEQTLGDRLRDPPPRELGPDKSRGALPRFGLLAVLVLLPFVWLAVLHVSMGSLLVEFRGSLTPAAEDKAGPLQPSSAQPDFDALGARFERLANEVRQIKREAAQKAKTRVAATPPAASNEAELERDQDADTGDDEAP